MRRLQLVCAFVESRGQLLVSLERFLAKRLRLKVNREKSTADWIWKR
ncbi:MAG TPA: hypothetical protein PLZ55_03075 [bacterium]|nr:hypothetical protein [bacterium]HQO36355.1 hypothetical protein [bacterium]HQP99314.1 hypothetical protein [bacterium]